MNGLVWKLLRKNISGAQVATYFIALLCGVAMVMLALQFRHDASQWLNPEANTPREFITVSKIVDRSGFNDNSFSVEEIDHLRREAWTDSVAPYISGDFSVMLSMNLGGQISTSMFLEAVPDFFLDTIPDGWSCSPDTRTVPLIIPRDYLTLYNYGFASSRSLPRLSESTLSRLPIRLTLSGNGRSREYDARIVGFSSRINSVIAPEEFVIMANRVYGQPGDNRPTRLIIRTYADSDRINRYLSENHLERSGEGTDTSVLSNAVKLLTTILIAIGSAIILLSVIIQILCLYLLVEKNRRTTDRLILLGYSPASLRRYYLLFILLSNLLTLMTASLLTPAVATLWRSMIPSAQFTPTPYIAGALIIIVLTLPVFPMLRSSIK
ncbi:MAG: hypothetical protein K2M07_01770 [Muribaculaceae bacterium]|nr:hypothetical protein [Muribaculaceae bacterium]